MKIVPLTQECPRCACDTSGQHGALSRTDDQTLVCDDCGIQEAFEVHVMGEPCPQVLWRNATSVFTIADMMNVEGE